MALSNEITYNKGSYQSRVAVIGAGVVGLSTALCIQNTIPSVDVTLIADKFNEETLSAGAGGLFRPEINIGPTDSVIRQWCQDSYDHFMRILVSSEENCAGVQRVGGYHLSSISRETLQNALLEEILEDYRDLTVKELCMFPMEFQHGVFYTTVVVDCRYYLSWMQKKFEEAGGKIILKTVKFLHELSPDFDIVINCTGLGAKKLMDDSKLVPIRGQTLKVKAPWIKHFYFGDEAYIIPGLDYVTLGGIKEYGSWNLKTNPNQKQFIWDKCIALVPSLEKAEVIWEWVGLRPFRQPVRVEKEILDLSGHQLKVVHNYGHGAHGVSLSWGTAKYTTQLVQQFLEQTSKL